MIKALIGGLAGGIVGAGLWAGITYATNYEIGLVAILVGVLVGGGVRWGAGSTDGWVPGLLAAALAIAAIVAAKYVIVAVVVGQFTGAVNNASRDAAADEEFAISYIGDDIARERERAGTPVVWPAGVEEGTAAAEVDYPADIWAEAERRWGQTHQAYRDAALTHAALASREHRIALMGHLVAEQNPGGYAAYVWPAESAGYREYATVMEEFPADLWAAAEQRLDATDDAGHTQFAQWASHRLGAQMDTNMQSMTQAVTQGMFASSFSLWDVLWIGLAVASAFKLGSGMVSE